MKRILSFALSITILSMIFASGYVAANQGAAAEASGATSREDHAGTDTEYEEQLAKIISIVDRAAEILEQKGEDGLDDVGAIRFDDDNYLFVNTLDGVTLVHIMPHLIGRSLLHLQDDTGKHFFQDFMDTARSSETVRNGIRYYNGAGWVRYRWPRPGEQEFVPKLTYVRGVLMGDQNVYVGAGIDDPAYLADDSHDDTDTDGE